MIDSVAAIDAYVRWASAFTPTKLGLVFHAASGTFDVLIDGAASECTSLPTKLQPPVIGCNLMDASNEGWGGRVDFTDLTIF